jgi:hypothetical protein
MQVYQHLTQPDKSTKEGARLESLLISLGHSLSQKFHSYKTARADKEKEWVDAIHQYEGRWDTEDRDKIEQALATGSMSDPVAVNITRPKTNIAIAKMKDIQFPTGGDFNFYLRPAPLTPEQAAASAMDKPDPTMQLSAAQAGVPQSQLPSPAAMVQEIEKANVETCPKMERKLRSRMIYADYGKKARLAIEDMCIKGSAVVKGPTIQNRKYRRYESKETQDGSKVQVLREKFYPEPNVERVDPILFFPDPSARLPEEIEDAFQLHPSSKTELIELSRNPAFMSGQIAKVLEQEPMGNDIPDIIVRTSRENSGNSVHNRYWLREYHGPLDKQLLFDAGMIDDEDFEDHLKQYTGEVWYCNNTVIRLSMSHIDGEDSLPYGLSVWEKDPNSVFGHGVPYLLRHPQRIVNKAYIMLLENAALTAGPQVVLNKEMIEPAGRDNDYTIEPLKVWFLTEYGADVRQAMQFVDIPAQMDGIASIIDTAMQFADVESSTPMIQQGEMPVGNNTTTGLAMVMSATNFIQKAASMNWDDNITRPLVQRFYHYEMQYGEDESVKGDYEVEVGGATERIEAQMRAQEIERMLGLAGSNPEFQMHVDAGKAFRALVDNTRTGDVLRTVEEVEQLKAEQEAAAQQQQQSDPELLKAQAAMITAESRQQEAAASAQLNNAKQQLASLEMQTRYQGQVAEAQSRQNEATLTYHLGLAKIAAEKEKSVMSLQKDLELADITAHTQLSLKEIDFAQFEREVEVKHEYGTGV